MAQEETKRDSSGTGEASIVASAQTPVSSIVPDTPQAVAAADSGDTSPKKKKKSNALKNPEKTSAKELLKQTESLRDVSKSLSKLNDGQNKLNQNTKKLTPLLEGMTESVDALLKPAERTAQTIKALCKITDRHLPQIDHIVGNIFTMMYDFFQGTERMRLQDLENKKETTGLFNQLLDTLEDLKKNGLKSTVEIHDKGGPDKDAKGTKFGKIAGIAAAALAIIPGMIRGFLSQIAKEIKVMFSDALLAKVRKIGTAISERFDKIVSGIKGVFRTITEPISVFFERLVSKGKALWRILADGPIGKLFDKVSAVFERMISKGRALLRIIEESAFGKFFSGLGEMFERLGSKAKALWRIAMDSPIVKWIGELGGMFKNLGTTFMEIVSSIKGVFGSGAAESEGIFKIIKNAFGSFGETFSALAPKFSALGEVFGKIMGKIALPLTIIMGIWDFFKGFTETEGSFVDKFSAGMIELVNGLVGWIVDIPKSLISWIAGKLGFTELEKELDAFSFKDFLKEFVNQGKLLFEKFFEFVLVTIPEFFTEIVPKVIVSIDKALDVGLGWIVDGITNLVGNVKDNFMDLFSGFTQIFDSIKGLFTGEVDFKTLFLQMIAGIVKTLLFPLNGVAKLVGFNITEKVLDLLGLKSSGGGSGASPAAAPASAVSAMPEPTYTPGFLPEFKQELALRERMVPNAQRADGQQLSEMSTQTQAARDEAALAAGGSNVVDASSRTNIINNNQTAAVSGSEIPDRTSGVFMMRFGY